MGHSSVSLAISAVDQGHHVFGIALTGGGVGRKDFVQAGEVLLREIQGRGFGVFFQIFSALGARNGDDVVSLRHHPGESELRRLASFFDGEFVDLVNEVEILLEIFALEAGRVSAVIVGSEIFKALDLSGEESAAERTVGDEADAEFAAGVEHAIGFGIACPERVFGLQRGDGMDFHGAAKSFRAGFGETEEADLAFADEFGHRSDRVFDGGIGIDAVLVVEVDGFDSEAAKAGLAGFADVVGLPAHAANVRVRGVADDAELGGEDDLVAFAFDGASDEFFVFVRTVDVGSVEKENPDFKGAVNGGDGFGIVAGTIKFRHAHTAETLC